MPLNIAELRSRHEVQFKHLICSMILGKMATFICELRYYCSSYLIHNSALNNICEYIWFQLFGLFSYKASC